MTIEFIEAIFEGLDCVWLENGKLAIWVTNNVGPKILGLSLDDVDNIIAVLPVRSIVRAM